MASTFIEAGTDETQDFSFWNTGLGGTGTLTSDSTQFQDGTRSIKCNNAASSDAAFVYTKDGIAADAGTRISSWFRFSTNAPLTRSLFMAVLTPSNGSLVIGVGMNTNGTIHLGARGTTEIDGSTVLAVNTWYRISLAYVLTSVSNFTIKVFVNGTLEATLTQANGNAGLTGSSDVSFGLNNSSQNGFTTPAAMTQWVDSIYIDSSAALTDPGNIHVTAKRPFANGTINGFTTQIGSGGSGYGSGHSPQVNEQPLSVTNGWSMVGAGSAVTEEYGIEGLSTGDVNLTGATLVDYMGWVYASALASETGSIIVTGVSSNISLTSANTLFTKIAGSTSYPVGGTDIGIITATTLTTVNLYECGIIFAYIPAASALTPRLALMGVG